jgi:IS1 family transposase
LASLGNGALDFRSFVLRVPQDKAVQIIHMLAEGIGVRAAARLASVHRDTVLAVLEVAGQKCARLMDERVRNVPFRYVEVDELSCFVHCKEAQNVDQRRDIGTQYVYLAIDPQSKFIINFKAGKRDAVTTQQFMQDLRKRVRTPFQLTTDGFDAYPTEVYYTFHNDLDYAQVIKQYANPKEEEHNPERRYSPSECISVRTKIVCGDPLGDKISTSYVERTNLSVRLFNRRFTRLTLG